MRAHENAARFFKAIEKAARATSPGPLNMAAIVRDKALVLQKASELLGYQEYLAKARAWKARQKSSTRGVEREVHAYANQALADSREMASAVLRVTSQMKQAGEIDRGLQNWITGLEGTGPVQVKDLWNGLVNDPATRQALKDHGLTDTLFASAHEGMSKLDGEVFSQDGKLRAEITFAGTDHTLKASFVPAATGAPRNVADLLKAGQFERLVDQFNTQGAAFTPFIPSVAGDLELPDVMLAGAVQSVQLVAQHLRNVQDIGLATYAGSGPIAAYVAIALVVALIGYGMASAACPEGHDHNTAQCVVGVILAVLGGIALAVLLGLWTYALAATGNTMGLVVLFSLVYGVGSEITSH